MSGTATVLSVYSYPTAVSMQGTDLDVFTLDPNNNNAISWKWTNSSTNGWTPQSNTFEDFDGNAAPFENGLAMVNRGGVALNLFIAGLNFGLYYKSHPASSGGWSPNGQMGI